jgi:hypothetical protein
MRRLRNSCSASDRVVRSHQIVSEASNELHDGTLGGGVRALCFAASTRLALEIGRERAGEFFEMLAGVSREVGKSEE